jgi:hypothetical protein
LYGTFVWARRVLNDQKRRFPARADNLDTTVQRNANAIWKTGDDLRADGYSADRWAAMKTALQGADDIVGTQASEVGAGSCSSGP